MSRPLPYDPIPDLARLLRVTEFAAPVGEPYPGSAADLLRQIRAGLGIEEALTAPEYELALYGQFALLAGGGTEWRQEFGMTEGVIECKHCRQQMEDGIIAHKLDCPGMWPG